MAKFVGSRTRSKEGPRHVTGRGLYTDDFRLPGMLQAMILRSPHAHAKINLVDPAEALKNPNVIAVITPDDVKQLTKPFKPGRYAAGLKRPVDEYVGAVGKVRYVREPRGGVEASELEQTTQHIEARKKCRRSQAACRRICGRRRESPLRRRAHRCRSGARPRHGGRRAGVGSGRLRTTRSE